MGNTSLPSQHYYLPDLVSLCPPTWEASPHYIKAGKESQVWIDGFNVLSPKRALFMEKSMLHLLTGYSMPTAGYEEIRTMCDFLNIITAFDDYSDRQDAAGALKSSVAFCQGIRGEPRSEDVPENIYQMCIEFRERLKQKPTVTERFLKRYVRLNDSYTEALAQEAAYREQKHTTPDIESYTLFRREFGAARPFCAVFEYSEGLDLPDSFWDHPAVQQLYWAAIDVIHLTNDAISYNKEQSSGDAVNNFVTVYMKQYNATLQQAMDFIYDEHRRLFAEFAEAIPKIPDFDSKEVQTYITSLEQGMIGNIYWCTESPRYHGYYARAHDRNLHVELWPLKELTSPVDNIHVDLSPQKGLNSSI